MKIRHSSRLYVYLLLHQKTSGAWAREYTHSHTRALFVWRITLIAKFSCLSHFILHLCVCVCAMHACAHVCLSSHFPLHSFNFFGLYHSLKQPSSSCIHLLKIQVKQKICLLTRLRAIKTRKKKKSHQPTTTTTTLKTRKLLDLVTTWAMKTEERIKKQREPVHIQNRKCYTDTHTHTPALIYLFCLSTLDIYRCAKWNHLQRYIQCILLITPKTNLISVHFAGRK